ncbi:MAG TPA: SDR family NAD(P)-dependent oxidoreductase [Chloroflexota bacterium]|jgi:3-oxoacyl-[acyl-carrier protein] reductase
MAEQRPVALVTGSASGIGRAEALALAGAGYDVVINYSQSEVAAKTTAADAEALGVDSLVYRCDVADEAQVRGMVSACQEQFGRLDVLCNNAGTTVNVPIKDLDGISVESWDRVFAVNVRGLFLVTRAAAPLLKQAKGCVVNTASIVGLRPGPQPLPYSASKAAVVSLTKTLAFALAPDVRVNAVAPGWMEGEWMERMLGDNYDGLMERRARQTPLKRCATAEDVVEVVLCLVRSMQFVTGEVVVIDGGFTSYT